MLRGLFVCKGKGGGASAVRHSLTSPSVCPRLQAWLGLARLRFRFASRCDCDFVPLFLYDSDLMPFFRALSFFLFFWWPKSGMRLRVAPDHCVRSRGTNSPDRFSSYFRPELACLMFPKSGCLVSRSCCCIFFCVFLCIRCPNVSTRIRRSYLYSGYSGGESWRNDARMYTKNHQLIRKALNILLSIIRVISIRLY